MFPPMKRMYSDIHSELYTDSYAATLMHSDIIEIIFGNETLSV